MNLLFFKIFILNCWNCKYHSRFQLCPARWKPWTCRWSRTPRNWKAGRNNWIWSPRTCCSTRASSPAPNAPNQRWPALLIRWLPTFAGSSHKANKSSTRPNRIVRWNLSRGRDRENFGGWGDFSRNPKILESIKKHMIWIFKKYSKD